jgi:hypothetical protein
MSSYGILRGEWRRVTHSVIRRASISGLFRRIDRMRILAKPMPTELTTPINLEGNRKMSVEAHRNLFCTAYDDCLNEAVRRGWNSFTCVRCPNYTVVESPEHSIEAFATQRKSA